MSKHYVILTEMSKHTNQPDEHSYYSHAFGCFDRRENATWFESFEAAQPKVKQLRAAAPEWFFNAVEVYN